MPLLSFLTCKIINSYKIRTRQKEKPLKIAVFLVFGGGEGRRLQCFLLFFFVFSMLGFACI